MKKTSFFWHLGKWPRVLFLTVLLLFGWVLLIVLKLFKGDSWAQEQKDLLGINIAQADAPPPTSTPFLAVWNGLKYALENDFLFGKPQSHFFDLSFAKKQYESGKVSPDLYKIQTEIKPENGKLKFQIQEIEPEESFLNWLDLIRVIHPKNTEIIVDSEYRKFHLLDKNNLEKLLVKPDDVYVSNGKKINFANSSQLWKDQDKDNELFLNSNDYISLNFNSLRPGEKFYLIIKSKYRDWILDENNTVLEQAKFFAVNFVKSKIVAKAATSALIVFGLFLLRKNISTGLLAPLFALSNCSSSGASSSYRCFPVFYKSYNGDWCHISTIYPRTWKYSSEIMELPREAVLNNGNLELKVVSTKRHYIDFIGLTREPHEVSCHTEHLTLERAYHNRLKADISNLILNQDARYLHTIPGDTVDLEFKALEKQVKKDEQETYLLRAGGFYISLRPESKKLAGNWQERISNEARARLATLVNLKDYK